MPLWAKIDVGLRHHPKLIGRPDADFRLWVGLILHAKEHCPDFILRDLSPSDMRGAFGIKAPARIVEAAIAYFLSKGMLIEQPDGGLLIKDMEERQGKYDQEEQRDKWKDIKRKQREKSTLSKVDNGGQVLSVLPLEVDTEKEEEQNRAEKRSRSKSLEATASQGVAFATSAAPVETPAPTAPTWEAYCSAYENRYGEKPVRNAKINGQLTQLIRRLPAEEAPDVAAFYVSHSGQLYVRAGHCVDLLLRDAEKLRTEWVTGRRITDTKARQEDRTAANAEGWAALLKGGENVG